MSTRREDPAHIVGVSGVVRDGKGRVLLIRTKRAGWELPGGRVEPGEDFISALEREVMEECCCQITVGRLGSVTSRAGRPNLTILTFECNHRASDPRPGDDSLEAAWFEADDAVRAVTHPTELLRLRDLLENDHGVIYRAHGQDEAGALRIHQC